MDVCTRRPSPAEAKQTNTPGANTSKSGEGKKAAAPHLRPNLPRSRAALEPATLAVGPSRSPTVSITAQGAQQVNGLRSGPVGVPDHYLAHRQVVLVGEDSRVVGPAGGQEMGRWKKI